MKILTFNEYVSQNETINEGFLDTLKTAIKRVVKDPKQYMDDNIKNIQGNLEKKMMFDTKEFYEKNKEEIMKELGKLCNDDDLKKIYNYMKGRFDEFKKDDKKYKSKYRLSYFDYIWSEIHESDTKHNNDIIRDNLYKDASDAKCFAVLEIMYAFYHKYFEKKEKNEMNKEEQEKKSGQSSYSSGSDDATFWEAVAAATIAI